MPKSNQKGFSLVEVVVAVALVGGVLAMIMGAVVILNRAVANERVVAFNHTSGGAAWAYQDLRNVFPSFTNAPSRLADAQADALWRQLKEVYEQSYAVAAMDQYLIIDFDRKDTQGQTSPWFIGAQGFISADVDGTRFPPLTRKQLTGFVSFQSDGVTPKPDSLYEVLNRRFGQTTVLRNFAVWNPAGLGIDMKSLRVGTVIFLGTQDRILGILRMRAWHFDPTGAGATAGNPYRYYEVSLTRLRWGLPSGATVYPDAVDQPWRLADGGAANFIQDYSYRFTEDRRYPQDLIYPPAAQGLQDWSGDNAGTFPNTVPNTSTPATDGRNILIRLSKANENYNAGDARMSRRQVSFAPASVTSLPALSQLQTPVDEWHIILPDPSLSQSEDRAQLRISADVQGRPFDATLDQSFRRQGKYNGAFSIYP